MTSGPLRRANPPTPVPTLLRWRGQFAFLHQLPVPHHPKEWVLVVSTLPGTGCYREIWSMGGQCDDCVQETILQHPDLTPNDGSVWDRWRSSGYPPRCQGASGDEQEWCQIHAKQAHGPRLHLIKHCSCLSMTRSTTQNWVQSQMYRGAFTLLVSPSP